MERVGFLGLGLMGGAMVERLLDRGHALSVWCRDRQRATPHVARGAELVTSPREVARRASLIGLMVADAHAVREVLRGAEGLGTALTAEHVIVNFSTVGAEPARSLARDVRSTGARYVDAPVLGSIGPARSGELLVFVGAEEADLAAVRPLLQSLARTIYHVGPVGKGSATKLVANMLLARYVSALGEVLALIKAFELDREQTFEIVQGSALASPMWNKAKSLEGGAVPVHFPLRHMLKDLHLLDEEVERAGLSFPVQEATYAAFQEAMAAGLGDRDYSELALFVSSHVARGR